MRTLTADKSGLTAWIDRTAKEIDEFQFIRELVQNGIEAGATEIVIDGWTDPESGNICTRVTDNGWGMTAEQLVHYLSTMHVQTGKGNGNYGVGARIAALPSNPAGVTFASRTEDEAMVKIVRDRGLYGIYEWSLDAGQTTEVVLPDDRELHRLAKDDTGTAVILHGNGRESTWTESVAYAVHKFLSDRYYAFPEDVTIRVQDTTGSHYMRLVKPFGDVLAEIAQADGEIHFKDVVGLDGVMSWWVLSESKSRKTLPGRDFKSGGVGVVVENEIFNYDVGHLSDFGVIYASIQNRVALLIHVEGASMDTGRGAVVLPANKKNIPWKKLGQHFVVNMPEEIDDLLRERSASTSKFDEEMAKLLDKKWMDKLNPVPVPVKAKAGDPLMGSKPGVALPVGKTVPEIEPPKKPPKKRRRRAAKRAVGGPNPAQKRNRPVLPLVDFFDPSEFTEGSDEAKYGIVWQSAVNTLMISEEFAPYVREVRNQIRDTSLPESMVVEAVQEAYKVEYAATIIDAGAQKSHGLGDEQIERLKSPEVLYGKVLGYQSLSERIKVNLQDKKQLQL